MNVLIIPEDFRNDQYILKPLFRGSLEPLEGQGRPFGCAKIHDLAALLKR